MTPLILAMLALALSGPVPWLLACCSQLSKAPRAALTLWQAVALAAILAALGAGLSMFTDRVWTKQTWSAYAVGGAALLLTLVVLGRLLLSAHRVGMRLRQLRREHRNMVDLLASDEAGVQVLEHHAPVAYCLPGVRSSRVVLSRAVIDELDAAELKAVLAHERAHLRARHDLVVEAFTSLYRAFPRVVSSRSALSQVQLLIEVLADRAAVRRVGPKPLGRALVAIAHSVTPEPAMGAGGVVLHRLELLQDTRSHRFLAASLYAAAALVLVLPTVLVAGPWLDKLMH